MPIVYKECAGGAIPDHLCNACLEVENGGLRGAAYIHKSVIAAARTADGLIDKTKVETLEFWNTAIEGGKTHVIPKTRGTFDGGSAVTVPGFGDVKEVVNSKDFTAVVNDPDHKENQEFYAALAKAPGEYHLAWRTGGELRISDEPAVIDPVDNTEEDVSTQVVWAANVTWTQKLPRLLVQVFDLEPVKEIFNCFEVTEA